MWIFHLRVRGAGTRLISRNRIIPPGPNRMVRALYDTVMAPGSLIMERRMLRGIKHRAEGLSGAGSAWRPGVRCG
ncbi:hypothetical protein [Actinoplanes sp. NPDC048796]|uniref:hypothetical protein n=1 Tax=Actinoplanes sp. NPDC048796 TaxID=3155640 RepID=UPI0033E44C6F